MLNNALIFFLGASSKVVADWIAKLPPHFKITASIIILLLTVVFIVLCK